MAIPEFTTEELESEEWREVPGFGGAYLASSLGRIKSKKHFNEIILRQSKSTHTGYISLNLCHEGKTYMTSVHRVVARVFLGPCPNGLQVNHIDGKKTNNRADNLEYVTPKQNMAHAFAAGLMPRALKVRVPPAPRAFGQDSPAAKLRDADIIIIRARLASGIKPKEIAQEFRVSRMTISLIKTGRTWAHIS